MPHHNTALPYVTKIIPHRPPHLWVDGVSEAEPGVSASGFWLPGRVHFDGHFEGMPLLPAVKQVESVAQLGAYAVMLGNPGTLATFAEIKNASFPAAVRPGDQLEVSVNITDKDRRNFTGKGEVRVGDTVTCLTTITGKLIPLRVAQRLFSDNS